MSEIVLIEAAPEYAEQVWQFRQEVLDHDKNSGSRFANIIKLRDYRTHANLDPRFF